MREFVLQYQRILLETRCNMARISIIMGIYNCADTLSEALESILAQTYDDWQMIMCDDGSTDDTYDVAKDYVNKFPDKFILIQNDKNRGLNYTLNHCLKYATGEFIARMDGDDISKPNRFAKEVEFLDSNHEYAIISCNMEFFDEFGSWGHNNMKKNPEKKDFLHGTPFCHAPSMTRKEAYDAVEGYTVDKKLLRVEDFHLWMKMYAKGYKGANLQDVLYSMRDNRDAFSRRKFKYRVNECRVIRRAIKEFKLPAKNNIYLLRPIIIGLLPSFVYKILHRSKMDTGKNA